MSRDDQGVPSVWARLDLWIILLFFDWDAADRSRVLNSASSLSRLSIRGWQARGLCVLIPVRWWRRIALRRYGGTAQLFTLLRMIRGLVVSR